MTCIYCGKAAIGIDLCHASHPVCAEHAHGHQIEAIPPSKPTGKRSQHP